MCIWSSSTSKTEIEKNLQKSINEINKFCTFWGFKINTTKTQYTTFTTAGYREKSYTRLYTLDLYIAESKIPLEPFPTFLGIQLDPKLCFKKHYERVITRITPKVNLIKRFKSLHFKKSIKTLIGLYKTLVRSVFDFCFVILKTDTQRISSSIQKCQNKILRQIKYFPLKTSTIEIHENLKIEQISARAENLFKNFAKTKFNSKLFQDELQQYTTEETSKRFNTLFDSFIH